MPTGWAKIACVFGVRSRRTYLARARLRPAKISSSQVRATLGSWNNREVVDGRRCLPGVWEIAGVFLEPLDLAVHFVKLVYGLGPRVSFAWRDVELAWHALRIQRTIHLDRLGHGNAGIVLADEENGGGSAFGDVFERRLIPVGLNRRVLLPQRSAHPEVSIPARVGLAVQRNPVRHSGVRR